MVRPAAPYDRTMKRLTNLFPVDFVRLVLGQGACRTEPLEIAAQDRELPAGEVQADAYVALRVLSGIVYPLALVEQVLHRRSLMLESPVYRQILEEGLQEGRQEGLCQDVLDVLEVRFGPVPNDVSDLVRQRQDLERLQQLLRRAVVVESLALFAQELRSGN